jgi:predicted membrane chloride channel (bestrophin family)
MDMGAEPVFDLNSGSLLERLIFRNRLVILVACAMITLLLGFSMVNLRLTASFESMIPTLHPFVLNYRANAQYGRYRGAGQPWHGAGQRLFDNVA